MGKKTRVQLKICNECDSCGKSLNPEIPECVTSEMQNTLTSQQIKWMQSCNKPHARPHQINFMSDELES
jgi:hypothetical protein